MNYLGNCVGWPRHDVHCDGGLVDMISDSEQVTRRTFLKHAAREDMRKLERDLGYAPPTDRSGLLRMCNDYHVSYHRSVLHGQRVYFFKHSAIEYVFG